MKPSRKRAIVETNGRISCPLVSPDQHDQAALSAAGLAEQASKPRDLWRSPDERRVAGGSPGEMERPGYRRPATQDLRVEPAGLLFRRDAELPLEDARADLVLAEG